MIDPATRDKLIAAAMFHGLPPDRVDAVKAALDSGNIDAFMGLTAGCIRSDIIGEVAGEAFPTKQLLEFIIGWIAAAHAQAVDRAMGSVRIGDVISEAEKDRLLGEVCDAPSAAAQAIKKRKRP